MALPERPELRIGDDVRERVVDDLRLHFAAGRLSITEFEERTAAALAAVTVADLQPLLHDLPEARPRPSGPPVRSPAPRPRHDDRPRAAVATWVVLAVVLNVIWVATGGIGDHWWPIWPMLGTGLPILLGEVNRRFGR